MRTTVLVSMMMAGCADRLLEDDCGVLGDVVISGEVQQALSGEFPVAVVVDWAGERTPVCTPGTAEVRIEWGASVFGN